MGKSCVRFTKLKDLPLEAVGHLLGETPPDAFIQQHEAARKR